MRRLKIAIDCDGVLADFTMGALKVVEQVTGRRYSWADVTAFDFTRALDLSAAESHDVKAIISSRQGFCASLAPYPKARDGVRRLRELGEVFCVTSPWDSNPWWRDERTSWLALHFGIDTVHHAEDKSPFEADVFVDDRSKHVRAWSSAWPGRTAVFWRTPHNTSEAVPAGAWSVSSWTSLYDIAHEASLGPAQPALPLQGDAP